MSHDLQRRVAIEKCRERFALFAKAIMPSLSLSDFHIKYYRVLHQFAIGRIKKLIVTVPPQHGKSQGSTILLPAYLLGINPDSKIVTASYSTTFARRFSRAVQRIINEPLYSEIFPETTLKSGNSDTVKTAEFFEISKRLGYMMSTGRGGQLTGNTVDFIILDDLYKDALEGNSPTIRDAVWEWYVSAVKSRLHNNSQELIVFTRWHEDDLIGRIEKAEEVRTLTSFDDISTDYKGWYKLNFEAIKENGPTELDQRKYGAPLWPEKHSLDLLKEKRNLDNHSFNSLYQGNPISKGGLLYSEYFKTYSTLPETIKKANYTDSADLGTDKLCSICYEVGKDGLIYITDILYTSEGMEITESLTADMLIKNDIRISYVESNNGGRGFARVLARKCPNIAVKWFHQSGNKESRILTNSATVLHNIIFPDGWQYRWPEFYNDITSFKRTFRANKFDDGPDVLTGIVEKELRKTDKKALFAFA